MAEIVLSSNREDQVSIQEPGWSYNLGMLLLALERCLEFACLDYIFLYEATKRKKGYSTHGSWFKVGGLQF